MQCLNPQVLIEVQALPAGELALTASAIGYVILQGGLSIT
jgi:hypothetical protein